MKNLDNHLMRVSITLLQYEHSVIRQVISCLKEIIDGELPPKHLKSAIEIRVFLTEYMDRFHHGKEEKFIFPIASGRSSNLKSVADDLLHDHERARELLGTMAENVHDDSIIDTSAFIAASDELVDLITEHIREEEDNAFPQFENLISVEEDQEITSDYRDFTIMEFDEDFPMRSEEFAFRTQSRVLGPGFYDGVI